MTWLSAIFSSLLATSLLSGATVSGTISLQRAKAKAGVPSDAAGVVLWLEPVSGDMPHVSPVKATISQKEKAFIPHVLAVPVNSTVEFPNFDPIFHNAFSNFNGQVFDVGLYPPGKTRAVKFRRPGIVRVFCNIHATMSAVIAVLRTPYFDVSASNGSFRMLQVEPGEYILKTFHERATPETLTALEKRITVTGDMTLPIVTISETGYIAMPHKNKYGKDYPARTGEMPGYPGARK